MPTIQLTQGKKTIVCECHYAKVMPWKWRYAQGYAVRIHRFPDGKWRTISINRFIMDTPKGMDTDHINGNPLDNRCSNLRVATRRQNKMNAKIYSNNTSGFKGVWFRKARNTWVAELGNHRTGGVGRIGSFKTKEEAALAYNEAARELFGEFAVLNKL